MEKKNVSNLRDLVDFAAEAYGEKVALRYFEEREIVDKSFNDIKHDSEAFASALSEHGLIGKHVAVIGPTSYEWIIAYLGTVNSGGVIVPIDKELPQGDICDALNRADVSALVYDVQYSDVAQGVRAGCPVVKSYFCMQLPEHEDEAFSMRQYFARDNQMTFSAIDREKLCAILFTSGTTGKSKGVMLCHRNLIDNVTCDDMGVEKTSIIMTVLPIHHAYCFTCDILLGMYLGVTVCVNDSVMRLEKNLKAFQPDIILLVPLIVESIYKKLCMGAKSAPLVPKTTIGKMALGGRLDTIYCGGAYLNPDLVDGFGEFGIKLIQGYGMTESSPRISANYSWKVKNTSVGKLVPGCEGKIVDNEIWVKSPSVMLGYYKNEEATNETLENGWLKTGDLGFIDDENFLFITGRKKNLIILSNGENVSPEELENKLSLYPIIAETMVYGEGGSIIAQIYPNMDYVKENAITDISVQIQTAIDEINSDLPLFRRIHGLELRDTPFEKTTSQKIKRTIK